MCKPGNKMLCCCYVLGLLFMLAPVNLSAGGITAGQCPKWVKEIKPDLNCSIPFEETKNGFYYILYDFQADVAHRAYRYHTTKKIINQTGVESCSQIELHYDNAYEHIIMDKLEIIRNGKVINKLDLSKLKTMQQGSKMDELQYDELKTGLIILEDVKPGDVLDYSYTFYMSNPLFERKFTMSLDLQFSEPMHCLYYRILMPEKRAMSVDLLHGAVKPTETVSDGMREFIWQLNDVKSLKLEDHTPAGYDPYPVCKFSEYKTWQEVKDWGSDIYTPVMVAGNRVKAKAKEIMAAFAGDTDRIIATLRFVQDGIRYMGIETGINTHKPHNPEQVLQQGYGDCKDKAVLYCCLLKEMQLKAYPVLIYTHAPDDMDRFLPSPTEFNHVCVAVDYGGRYHYFDPTINYQRGTFSNTWFPVYKFGLVLLDNTTTLLRIPPDAENPVSRYANRLEIHDTVSPAKLTVTTTLSGADADNFRQEYAQSNVEDFQKNYLNYYASIFPDIKVANRLSIEKDDSVTNTIVTNEVYDIDNIWVYSELTKKWKVKFSVQNLTAHITKPKNYNRAMPLGIGYPLNYYETYDITFPDDKGDAKQSIEVVNNAFYFSMRSSGNESTGGTHLEYIFRTKAATVPVAEIKSYHKDVEKITENSGYGITLTPGTDTANSKPGVSGFMLFILLLTLAAMVFVCRKLYVEYDIETPYTGYLPIDFGGWLLLPMFGTVITPLWMTFSLLQGSYTSDIYNDILFNKLSPQYNPVFGLSILTELVLHVMQITLFTLAAVLMFKKRSSYPHIFIAACILGLVSNSIDYALVIAYHYSEKSIEKDATAVARSLVYVLIWVSYMLKSDRVKQTFTYWHPARNLPLIEEPEISEYAEDDTTVTSEEVQYSVPPAAEPEKDDDRRE